MNDEESAPAAARAWDDAGWDIAGSPPTTLRYAVNGMAQGGAAYFAAQLRRRGIGIPFQYLDDKLIPTMAARLGCWDVYGQMDITDYLAHVAARRTTANGIFGIELRPMQVAGLFGEDQEKSARFWQWFDKFVWVRCRDKLAQAAAAARSRIERMPKKQQLYIKEVPRAEYGIVSECLHGILVGEGVAGRFAEQHRGKVRFIDYEDLGDASLVESAARWLSDGRPQATAPVGRGDAEDGFDPSRSVADLDLKRRFLEYIGAFR